MNLSNPLTQEKALEGIKPKKIIQRRILVLFYFHRKLSFPAWPQGWKDWSLLLINGLILSMNRSGVLFAVDDIMISSEFCRLPAQALRHMVLSI